METGDVYGRRGLPVLATMLADALMVGTGSRPVWAEPRSSDEPGIREEPAPTPLLTRARSSLRGAMAALDHWLHRQTMKRWEAYLAEAQNVHDLEMRIRRLERNERHLYRE